MKKKILIIQGGGPTAVINQTLASFMEACIIGDLADTVLGSRHTLDGADSGDFFDLLQWCKTKDNLNKLKQAPGAFLGSSRTKTESNNVIRFLNQIIDNDIDTIVGIGGNGTMKSLELIQEEAQRVNIPLSIIGISKTVDNDLEGTFISPGFASAAQFVAQNTQELGFDFQAMDTFDNVIIFETMGRNTGWLAASSVAYKQNEFDPPHLVYIPERTFSFEQLIEDVNSAYKKYGRVFIVCSEALTNSFGEKICTKDSSELKVDSLGRTMYSFTSGTAHMLALEINQKTGLSTRTIRPGIAGRSSMAYISQQDKINAHTVGNAAAGLIQNNDTNKMIGLDENLSPKITPINEVASHEKSLPDHFLSDEPPYIKVRDFQQQYLDKCLNPIPIKLKMPYND